MKTIETLVDKINDTEEVVVEIHFEHGVISHEYIEKFIGLIKNGVIVMHTAINKIEKKEPTASCACGFVGTQQELTDHQGQCEFTKPISPEIQEGKEVLEKEIQEILKEAKQKETQ